MTEPQCWSVLYIWQGDGWDSEPDICRRGPYHSEKEAMEAAKELFLSGKVWPEGWCHLFGPDHEMSLLFHEDLILGEGREG